MNKKALSVYLALTFGLTISMVIVVRLAGFSLFDAPSALPQLVIYAAMFVPAICAIITQKLVVKKPLKELGFRFGPWKEYAKAYGIVLLTYVINYAIVWLFVLQPDFTLQSLLNQYASLAPGLTLPMPAWQMVLIFNAATLIAAPLFNFIPALGEEVGWRGFLLPNLEPMGRAKAAVISGMIHAVWHTPMILILGFGYGHQAWIGAILHFLMVTSLGTWMGYVFFKTRSTILAAFIHAVFNANAYGIWVMLFVSNDKFWVGPGSVIGVGVWLLVGAGSLWVMRTSKISKI